MYALMYIVIPIVVGILAASRRIVRRPPCGTALRVAVYRGVISAGMLTCGVLTVLDLTSIARALNGVGRALFGAIVFAQLGLGILAAIAWVGERRLGHPGASAFRAKLAAVERPLGVTAIATGVAMLIVRLRIIVAIF